MRRLASTLLAIGAGGLGLYWARQSAQISGSTPSLLGSAPARRFRDRCERAGQACGTMPDMTTVDGRALRCHYPLAAAQEAA